MANQKGKSVNTRGRRKSTAPSFKTGMAKETPKVESVKTKNGYKKSTTEKKTTVVPTEVKETSKKLSEPGIAVKSDSNLALYQKAVNEQKIYNALQMNTEYYQGVFERVTNAMNNYVYSEDPEKMKADMLAWEKEAYVEDEITDISSGQTVKFNYLKATAPPPPLGKNDKGESVDIAEDWRAFTMLQQVNTDASIKTIEDSNAKWERTAGISTNKPDSFLDVFREAVSGKKDIVTGSAEYMNNYILNPIKAGEWGTLGMNAFVNIGETMDFLAGGTRALLATPVIFGIGSPVFEGQEVFVYSGGSYMQQLLVDAGAYELLSMERSGADSKGNLRKEGVTRTQLENRLKEQGLYEEYLKLKDEWFIYEGSSGAERLKEYYTNTEANYYADTGNKVGNFVMELVTDPTLVIGGISKLVVKAGKEAVINPTIIRAAAEAGIEIEQKAITKAKYALGNSIFSATKETLEKTADEVVRAMNLADNTQRVVLKKFLVDGLLEYRNSKSFSVAKGFYKLGELSDKVDSALLQPSLWFTPLGVKAGGKLKETIGVAFRQMEVDKMQKAQELFKTMVRSDGEYNPAMLHAMLNTNEIFSGSVKGELRMLKKQMSKEMHELESIVRKVSMSAQNVSEAKKSVNDFIKRITDNKIKTYTAFKDYLNTNLAVDFAKYPGEIQDLITAYSTVLDDAEYVFDFVRKRSAAAKNMTVKNMAKKSEVINAAWTELTHKTKNIFDVVKNTASIKTPYSYDDLLIRPGLSEEITEILDELAKQSPDFKELKRLSLVELNERVADELVYLNLMEGLGVKDIDHRLQYRDVYQELFRLTDEATQLVLSNGSEIIDTHLDKTITLAKYLVDEKMMNLTEIFEGLVSQFDMDSLSTSEAFSSIYYRLSDLESRFSQLRAFNVFSYKIKDVLSDRQYLTVLQALFGIEKNMPDNYFIRGGSSTEDFLRRIETTLYSQFGESRLSLDGFRSQALDFRSDFYKKFATEIEDAAIQERIKKICRAGHEDPADDVNVQMLQMIFKSPDAVALYNSKSEIRDVFFLDIETTGMNKDFNQISSIATKKWVPITEDMSLSQILDIIEDDSTTKVYQTFRPEKELANELTSEFLDYIYRNNHKVAVNQRNAAYYAKYSSEANGGKVVTEQEIISDFMYDMDTSWGTRDQQLPTVVVHNSNDFDTSFIIRRANLNRTYFDSFPDLQAFAEESMNSLTHLKEFTQDDLVLLSEQKVIISDALSTFAKEMRKANNSMSFLDLTKLDEDLRSLLKEVQELENTGKLDLIRESFTGLEEVVPLQNQSAFKKLVELYDSGQFDELVQTSKEFTKNLWVERREFNSTIYNTFRETSDSPIISNFIKKALEANSGASFSPLGYRIVANTDDISRIFGDAVDASVSHRTAKAMQQFTESIKKSFELKIKTNQLVPQYVDEFINFIQKVKEYASTLPDEDILKHYAYLTIPENAMQIYLVARKIWDDSLKHKYNDIVQKAIIEGKLVPDSDLAKSYASSFAIRGFISDFSDEGLAILRGEADSIIYKNVCGELYSDKFVNESLTKSLEYSKAREHMRFSKEALSQIGLYHAGSEIADVRNYRSMMAMTEFVDVYDSILSFEHKPKVFNVFEKYLMRANTLRMNQFTEQIINSFIEASNFKEQLTSHLLFNNHFLILPVTADDYVSDFIRMLQDTQFDYISYQIVDEQLFVYLNKNAKVSILNDAVGLSDETTMMLVGEDTIYKAPKYDAIAYPGLEDVVGDQLKGIEYRDRHRLGDVVERIKNISGTIDNLTGNNSLGSTGELHTYTKHKRMLASLPLSVKRDMISESVTCDARLWHQASFERSILGNAETRWKISNYEEADMIKNLQNTLYEVAGQHAANMAYLDYFFGNQSTMKLSRIVEAYDLDEAFDAMQSITDHVVVLCKAAKTDSGFEVFELAIKSTDDLKYAIDNNAVFVPYEVYTDMVRTFNESTINNTFLKIWSKAMVVMKVGQLFKPATAARNLIDGFIKASGEVGSATETFDSFIQANELLVKYEKVSKQIAANNRLGYYSENYVKKMFDKVSALSEIMDYDTYSFISGLFQQGPMGGMSHQIQDIIETANVNQRLNLGLKSGNTKTMAGRKAIKEAYDIIGDTVSRFGELGESEIKRLMEDHSDVFIDMSVTPEEVLAYALNVIELNGKKYLDASSIIDKLITARAKEAQGILSRDNSYIDDILSNSLGLMSRAEGIIRLGEYIALEKQGYTKNDIFRKISASQFDYDVKSRRVKMIEMAIPYYTFEVNNLRYWINQCVENPQMLHFLETIWGELSFDAAYENFDPEDPMNNQSLDYMAQSGGVPIGDSGLYMKVNPSFYSAIDSVFGGPSTLLNKMAPPIQYLSRHGLKAIGADYWGIMNEVDFDFSNEPLSEQVIRSTPLVSSLYSMWKDSYAKQKYKNVQDNLTAEVIAAIDPFMFGVVTRYHTDEAEVMADLLAPYLTDGTLTEDELKELKWESFMSSLEAQGKWYDKNWGKIVDISQKNTEGLNGVFDFDNDPKAWQRYCHYQKIYKGKYWDYNQRKFVSMAEYIPGMLNRKFDFENDENAWEEFCYYNEELFGTKWDNNQGAFVTSDKYIEGGLNADDLTFSQLCILKYALHGETWNQETHKFEQTSEPLVIFEMGDNEEIDLSTITIRKEDQDLHQKVFQQLMAGSVAYGSTFNQVSAIEPIVKEGKFVFNTDPTNNTNVILTILNTVQVPGISFTKDYTSGIAGGYNYSAKPYTKELSSAQLAQRIARYGGGFYRYGTAYSGSGSNQGIKLATTSGFMDVDPYSQAYKYGYQYKNPIVGTANYPQSKLGIQRYMRMRMDSLQRRFRSRTPANARRVTMDNKISVRNNLNRLKLGWWNRY